MVPVHLYNVVCVRDWTTSQKWFEVFFGRPADELIGEECPWQAGENAWVVIDDRYVRAARAGGTMITIGVTDLDDILARLAAHRIKHEPAETYGNGVRHVEVLDPDGNSLSLAEMPAERAGRFPFVRRKARPGASGRAAAITDKTSRPGKRTPVNPNCASRTPARTARAAASLRFRAAAALRSPRLSAADPARAPRRRDAPGFR
jgi:hypothetical protein